MLIPGPDTRVVELRVHGILGTTPERLMDTVAAVDVAGDGLGRVVRPADRLRRPAPGPVLKADGRPLPRTLEGYVWSGMTSGGLGKAIWALLFPFSLANVASWMLPPVPEGSTVGHLLGVWCRALLRLAALLLTMLMIGQLAAVSADLLATQCLAPGSRCLSIVPGWLRTAPAFRPLVGLVPPLLVVLVLARVSRVSWTASTTDPQPEEGHPRHRLNRLPGARKLADPEAPVLRSLHLTAALATVSLIVLGGPRGPEAGGVVAAGWWASAALVVVPLVLSLVLLDPTGARPSRGGVWLKKAFTRVTRHVLFGLGLLLLAVDVAVRPTFGATLAGTDATLNTVTVVLALTCVALGLLLAPAAVLARKRWADLPTELRPWAGGWLAAPFMALASLLGGGFGAGIGITVRQALGGSPLALPGGYAYVTLLWGVAGALAAGAFGVFAVVLGVRRLVSRPSKPPEVPLLHADRQADASVAARSWRMASLRRRHSHHVLLGVVAVLVAGAAVSAVPWLRGTLPPVWLQPLSGFGLAVLVVFASALLREVYTAARQPNAARHLGGLSDLCCFWPRESHPIVPPCYALKVVPELAARVAEHLEDPGTRVVLAGHSQGTLLAAAAAARLVAALPHATVERLGLVFAGSPIQWAYQRAFPAVLPHDGLSQLYGDLDGRSRTLCRGTDPIGGGLSTWRRQAFDEKLIGVGFRDDGTSGALSPAVTGPTGALVLGGDHWLPDPERGPFPGRRWSPGVNAHADYFSDPEWDRAVACAAGVESPTEFSSVPTVFRLPGRNSAVG